MGWHHEECWEALGRCATCQADGQVGGAPARGAAPPAKVERRPQKKLQPRVTLPKGVTLDETGSELVITRSWFHWSVLFLTVFCVFWDGFLVMWYGIALHGGARGAAAAPMLLFPLIHVAVGVGLTYFVVCSYVNRTVVTVNGSTLSVRHAPLPWPGNQVLDARRIDQLYCMQKVSHTKNGTRTTYELYALDPEQRKTRLLKGLQDPDQVRFLEQEIERYLGIEDRPVSGELRS